MKGIFLKLLGTLFSIFAMMSFTLGVLLIMIWLMMTILNLIGAPEWIFYILSGISGIYVFAFLNGVKNATIHKFKKNVIFADDLDASLSVLIENQVPTSSYSEGYMDALKDVQTTIKTIRDEEEKNEIK